MAFDDEAEIADGSAPVKESASVDASTYSLLVAADVSGANGAVAEE